MDELIVTAANWRQYENELGAKARNLFFLQEKGFAVPPLLAVRDSRTGAVSDLEAEIACLTAADPEETLYAVRSSAAAEDSPERSFAGLFETFLCVRKKELAAHVEQCRASAQSERVRLYAACAATLPVCVIIQQMIHSRAAGVLFTVNPAGALTETVIVAAYGLGEGVVQDHAEADTYILDRLRGTLRIQTAHKIHMVDVDSTAGHGVSRRPIAQELADRQVLTEAEARALAATGADIGSLYPGHFLDIEWCLDEKSRVWILQCRPVTSIPSGEFTLIDNSNIVEGYPGITQALTFSILKDGYRKNLTGLLQSIGMPRQHIDGARRALEHMVCYIEGRVYYNLSSWYRVFGLVPGLGSRLIPLFDAMIGAFATGSGQAPAATESIALKNIYLYARVVPVLLFKFLSCKGRMRRYKDFIIGLEARFRAQQLDSMSNHALLDLWLELDTSVFRRMHTALLNDLFLMILVAASKKALGSGGFDDVDGLFNGLMCGGEGMESVLPVRSLVGLAEKLRADSGLAASLEDATRTGNPEDLARALALDGAFAHDFQHHVSRYGDRLPEELKVETVSFREDELLLAAAVVQQAAGRATIAGLREREVAVRSGSEEELCRGLVQRPLLRAATGFLLQKTREALAYRESSRLDRARIGGFFRSLARALGANLSREGALAEPLDICHLSFDELKEYVTGSAVETDLRGVVARRKEALRLARQRSPAERMILRGTVYRNFIVQSSVPGQEQAGAPDAADMLLQGIACSPGIVTAEAVVIDNPAAAPPVQGKIIVAKMTDPGWVFLMVNAAGLIVEKGSLLSHTAIIGRELGVPTIVGVGDATRRLQSGQRIRMDGATGLITLDN